MLHGTETPFPRQRCTKCRFESYLFIGCPLRIQFFIFCRILSHLRTGCPWITGYKTAACLIETSGNCFVAEHQCFHISFSSLSLIADGICHRNRYLLLVAGEHLLQFFLPRRLCHYTHHRHDHKPRQHAECAGINRGLQISWKT